MFEENETLVNETENVAQTTEEIVEGTDVETSEEVANEEPVQMFTKEQVDEMIAKKLARK